MELLACASVSVHPNVPSKDKGKWQILGRKTFLMLSSFILAPEIMVMWGIKQWRDAVMVRGMMNQAKPRPGT